MGFLPIAIVMQYNIFPLPILPQLKNYSQVQFSQELAPYLTRLNLS